MKAKKIISVLICSLAFIGTSCENGDIDFPDYDGGITVYFSHQYPVRTIEIGEDNDYSTELDNAHQCEIQSTMGGSYNGKNITVSYVVDNSLVDNLYFDDGTPVKAMPTSYYSLLNDQLVYGGNFRASVRVQLNDAFFNDPAALTNTYVIPLRMTEQVGADSILLGKPNVEGTTPAWTDASAWSVLPQNYVLYCIKYINEWHGTWLRRGIDEITESGTTTKNVRHGTSVEKDEVCSITTRNLKTAIFPITTNINNVAHTCNLLLTFDDNGNCTITTDTDGMTASGSGKFVKKGEKKAWGNKDRDALYLDYNIDFGGKKFATKDTLVTQDRGVVYEEFSPTYKAN